MTSTILRSLVVGVVAASLALVGWGVGGAQPGALEWAAYDHWLRSRAAGAASGRLLIVTRDPASEARFGAGPWDAAVVARLIGDVARAGAVAIGVDAPPGRARGGPASEALLQQATALAGNVVYAVGAEPAIGAAMQGRGPGHTLTPSEPDGVVRRVPPFAPIDGAAIPAFGVALAATVLDAPAEQVASRAPINAAGRALVGFAAVEHLTVDGLAAAIEQGRIDDRLVILLTEPNGRQVATPIGLMSEVEVHAQLATSVLSGQRLRIARDWWTVAAAIPLAAAAAWLWMALPWPAGLAGAVALAFAAVVAAPLGPRLASVLPVVWPALAAMGLASMGALVWNHFAAADRIRRLEDANADARDELVRRESAVEALEEDLEAARAAIARSTGAERDLGRAADRLLTQLNEARAQEEQTRRRLEELEAALHGRRAGSPARGAEEAERLGIVTRDAAMLGLFHDLEKAARSTLPILLAGEPGTGKELFARAAHRLSPRAGGPFVAVNMAAIPPELFESELFGHVRGAFTGAAADRKGYFEQADRGTIFLDEVGDVRPEHQSKLLRALQEKTFYRVGATKPTAVDVRVVAATNRDLERGVAEGWFREDLYFRLKGLVLCLPPLRERRDDVPLLADCIATEAAVELGRTGLALSADARAALQRHDWPGNVRELQNCLRQAAALAEGPLITPGDLRLPAARVAAPEPVGDATVLGCLRRHGFDMQATARELGWDRSTVTQRLKGLGFRALVDAGGDLEKAALMLAGDAELATTVELKLGEYYEHLMRSVNGFSSATAALAACRRRFKNLPERHFRSLETLVRQYFDRRPPA